MQYVYYLIYCILVIHLYMLCTIQRNNNKIITVNDKKKKINVTKPCGDLYSLS